MGKTLRPLHAEVEKNQSLEVKEVIDDAYRKVVEKYSVKEIRFKGRLAFKTFEYRDEHGKTKTQIGTCDKLNLVAVGVNHWLIGQVEPYSLPKSYGNIAAINVDEGKKNKKELTEHFKRIMDESANSENRNYIIYGNSDGKMDAGDSFPEMRKYLSNLDLDGLVSNVYEDYTDGFPPERRYTGPSVKYTPGMVKVLKFGLLKVLRAPPALVEDLV
jgi:hypothetical protein